VILKLVDRRGPVPDAADWFAESGPEALLAGLATGLGRDDWTVDLALVDDAAMTALNQDFRGAEGVTDVLSFSYLEADGPGLPDLAAGTGRACSDLWLEPVARQEPVGPDPVVGEIVLAPGFIARRCAEKEWPLDQEMPMLVVHGLLHVLGWDHRNESETEAMQVVEQEILAAAGLPHPMRERG
jgi:probable rRNA maturation factor